MLFIISMLLLSGLFLSVNGGNFELNITDIKIEIVPKDDNLVDRFCSIELKKNVTCIQYLHVCFQNNCVNLSILNFPTKPIPISNTTVQISSDVKILNNLSDIVIHTSKSYDLSSTTNRIELKNKKEVFFIILHVTFQCMRDYILPDCSEIDLCEKIPLGFCQNGGRCTQNNYKLSCICPKNFTGNFCKEKTDPCQDSLCSNNSKCHKGLDNTYTCQCPQGFTGQFCNIDIDECQNKSNCLHFQNSTCVNTYGSHICLCGNSCETLTSNFSVITKDRLSHRLLLKWPLSDLDTLILVVLEGALIVMLILILIFIQIKRPLKKKKPKIMIDDSQLFVNRKNHKKVMIEFDPNFVRTPLIKEDNRQSKVPIFDAHEIEESFVGDTGNKGMSTFGRR